MEIKEQQEKLAFINNSPNRQNTVKTLQGKVETPTNIAKDIGIKTTHVSKILSELKKLGLAECINEEYRKGRLYRLTPSGEEIARLLSENE
ncbi:transcriptional regulator [Methanobrevibacter sp.]